MTQDPLDVPPHAPSSDAVWAIRRADGFMDLKMWRHAARELDKVPSRLRGATPVLQLRLRAAMAAEDWASARESAQILADRAPGEPAYWVQLAYSTRRAVSLEAAHAILSQAIERFPDEAIFPYNLGCYECCRGNEGTALAFLRKAFELDASYVALAVVDPDLSPVQQQLAMLVADQFGEVE